jgi:hypothetical protein
LVDVKPRITDESMDKSKVWKLMEIADTTQCRSLKLGDNHRTTKVVLSYLVFYLDIYVLNMNHFLAILCVHFSL